VVEDVIVKKFTFAISSPDEFLVCLDTNNLDSQLQNSSGKHKTNDTKKEKTDEQVNTR